MSLSTKNAHLVFLPIPKAYIFYVLSTYTGLVTKNALLVFLSIPKAYIFYVLSAYTGLVTKNRHFHFRAYPACPYYLCTFHIYIFVHKTIAVPLSTTPICSIQLADQLGDQLADQLTDQLSNQPPDYTRSSNQNELRLTRGGSNKKRRSGFCRNGVSIYSSFTVLFGSFSVPFQSLFAYSYSTVAGGFGV